MKKKLKKNNIYLTYENKNMNSKIQIKVHLILTLNSTLYYFKVYTFFKSLMWNSYNIRLKEYFNW